VNGHHGIARPEITHTFPDGGDDTGKLMTERGGEWHLRVAAAKCLEVGAAGQGGADSDEHFPLLRGRIWQVAGFDTAGGREHVADHRGASRA
jgi:hypothetical protein